MSSEQPQRVCFDGSGFLGLPDGTRRLYESYWNTFQTIFLYDVQVSTLRGGPEKLPLTYWTYTSGQERVAYINGRSLLVKRYPNSNWNVSRD